MEVRCKQKISVLTLPRSAAEARNAYTVLWFVRIMAQVNLFYVRCDARLRNLFFLHVFGRICIVPKTCRVKPNVSNWSHWVEQVYLGYNHNKFQPRWLIPSLGGILCLHLSPTSVHNLRNFLRRLSFMYIFALYSTNNCTNKNGYQTRRFLGETLVYICRAGPPVWLAEKTCTVTTNRDTHSTFIVHRIKNPEFLSLLGFDKSQHQDNYRFTLELSELELKNYKTWPNVLNISHSVLYHLKWQVFLQVTSLVPKDKA